MLAEFIHVLALYIKQEAFGWVKLGNVAA